jgi:hypothetical protein
MDQLALDHPRLASEIEWWRTAPGDGLRLAGLVTERVRATGRHHRGDPLLAALEDVERRHRGHDAFLDAFLDCILARRQDRFRNQTYPGPPPSRQRTGRPRPRPSIPSGCPRCSSRTSSDTRPTPPALSGPARPPGGARRTRRRSRPGRRMRCWLTSSIPPDPASCSAECGDPKPTCGRSTTTWSCPSSPRPDSRPTHRSSLLSGRSPGLERPPVGVLDPAWVGECTIWRLPVHAVAAGAVCRGLQSSHGAGQRPPGTGR